MTAGTDEQRERSFDHREVEHRWQQRWAEADVFHIPDDAEDPTYVLAMFPYPSGEMHMGHVRNYAITDAVARYERMQGESVLHPMGWDSFGLPAENAANERDVDPRGWTMDCIANIKEQMQLMGLGFDWQREITTCEPDYFRWNQWLFLTFREQGLVERQTAELNWCSDCETVLANEQVEGEDERCWRCGTPIVHRDLDQWFFTITDYADELYTSLDDMTGWPDNVREMQRNWIGRQEGDAVAFEVPDHGTVEIFTTRLDTIYGATFFALSPGHDLAQEFAAANEDVAAYVEEVEAADDEEIDETSGVFTGEYAINPATGEEIPVYVADYVLSDVGTGALYAVPAHDDRDHAFAGAHDIPIRTVIEPAADDDESLAANDDESLVANDDESLVANDDESPDPADESPDSADESPDSADESPDSADESPDSAEKSPDSAEKSPDSAEIDIQEAAYTEDGVLVNSGDYDGLTSAEAREEFVEVFDGEHRVEYSLQDWCLSRQRYWGTPIPMVTCSDCGHVPVPEDDLPVELPAFVQTTGNPLEAAEDWTQTTCPECGGDATRETDTMDTFVDSSWYFLRFISPDLETAPFDVERATDWMPVDQYVGGIEHATMHLIYSRFFTKVLADMDMLEVREPFADLVTQGMVRKGGTAMSSSTGNVVSPRSFVERYGADTARLFIMNAAQPEKDFDWTEEGARSAHRFLQNVYSLTEAFTDGAVETAADAARDGGTTSGGGATGDQRGAADYLAREIDATAATATEEFEQFRFNHALQAVRDLVALLRQYRQYTAVDAERVEDGLSVTARLMAPIAPHVAEELWTLLDGEGLVAEAPWPDREPPADYEVERRLVENTREDVRDIVDVAGITDAESITIVTAPVWKHVAHERARESDADNLVGDLMRDDQFRQHGDAAASFAKDLQAESEALSKTLPPETERAALERAAWLTEREFDASVAVESAAEAAGDLASDAEPGRPAIHIE